MGVLLVLGAIVVAAIALAGRADESGATGNGGICRRQEFPAQGQRHLRAGQQPPKGFEYNSFPPTSGYHDENPAIFDAYSQPVPERHLIHNLEHGGIVVQYGKDVSRRTIDQIVQWWNQDPTGIVVSPLPNDPKAEPLRDKITIAAWTGRKTPITDEQQEVDPADAEPQKGHLAICSRFDEEAFSDFRDDYRFRGPEPYRPSQLEPGG